MKRFKFTFVMLAAVAMLSMSLNTPHWIASAQKMGDGAGASPIVYPTTKRLMSLTITSAPRWQIHIAGSKTIGLRKLQRGSKRKTKLPMPISIRFRIARPSKID